MKLFLLDISKNEFAKGNNHINANCKFCIAGLNSLSAEARQKLKEIRPASIGQASRISGVSATDIAVIAFYLGR